MSVFLIDYENVGVKGLMGISSLNEEDKVYLLYSKNADTLTFEMHEMMNNSKAEIKCIKADVGTKNALDFQLSSKLGYLVAANKKEQFYVVSDDSGFDCVVKFWTKDGCKIERVSNLQLRSKAEEQLLLENKIIEILPQYKEDAKIIEKYIEDYKTKQGFNNALVKRFESKKAGEIYKAVKPLIADKKGK
jgi:hypothetical protein